MFDAKTPGIVEQLPVDDTIRAPLGLDGPITDVLRHAIVFEDADLADSEPDAHIADAHYQAVVWTTQLLNTVGTALSPRRATVAVSRVPRLTAHRSGRPRTPARRGAGKGDQERGPETTAVSEQSEHGWRREHGGAGGDGGERRGPPLREPGELHQPGEEHGVERCDAEPGERRAR